LEIAVPISIEIVQSIILFGVCLVLAAAGIWDVRIRKIPNWTILSLVCLFLAWQLTIPPVRMLSSLEAALIMFVCSITLYAFHIVGAGDSKLVTVAALFIGFGHLPQFVLYMSVVGGALALYTLAKQPTRVLVILQMRGKARFDRGVPYGVAVAVAGIACLMLPSLSLFPSA
jgi:prepilin peptidase CpaA